MKKEHKPSVQGNYEDETTSLEHLPTTTVPPTNDMALVSYFSGIGGWLIAVGAVCPLSQYVGGLCFLPLAFVAWSGALFTGFIARGQIASSGEEGGDMATRGLIAGAAGLILGALALVALALLLLLGLVSFGALTPYAN